MGAGNQEIPVLGFILAGIVILAVIICLSGCAIIIHEIGGMIQ